MTKRTLIGLLTILCVAFVSCKDDDGFSDSQIAGYWKQIEVSIDGMSQNLTPQETNTSMFIEPNGVYRLYDGSSDIEHGGTWILTDEDWLTMSMNKISGKNVDGSYRYEQIPIRFTVLQAGSDVLEIRIKTTLGKRKTTVMFNQMEQDSTPETAEEALELDTLNKTMHTYIYKFKRTNQ